MPVRTGEYLEGHLHQRLTEDPRVSEQGIAVKVAGVDIFLTGVVVSPERRDAITAVATEYADGHRVHNDVTIGSFPEPSAEETLS
jgi:osmotically-inducible protein OsmY